MSIDSKAVPILCNNHWNGREGYTPRYIILHATAGGSSAQNIAEYFRSTEGTNNPVSVNYIIGQDGAIVCSIDEDNAAYGNGVFSAGHDSFWNENINPNLVSLSIEHVKPSTDNSDALTPAQQAASFGLVQRLCERWSIPKRTADANGGITGHFSIDPVNRLECPGTYPWQALWNFLKDTNSASPQEDIVVISLSQAQVAQYFEQRGSFWYCKQTGKSIGNAILNWYRLYGNSALCGLTYLGLPLTDEVGIGNGATIQRFERGNAVYDPDHKHDNPPASGAVYLSHIYDGFGVDPRIAPLNQQIATLKAQLNAKPDTQLQAQLAQREAQLKDIEERAKL